MMYDNAMWAREFSVSWDFSRRADLALLLNLSSFPFAYLPVPSRLSQKHKGHQA